MVERVVHGEGVDARVAVLEGSDEQEGVVKDGVGRREKVGLQGLKGLLVFGGKCGEDLNEGPCGVEGGVWEARCTEAGDGVCRYVVFAGAEDLDGSEIREVLDSRAEGFVEVPCGLVVSVRVGREVEFTAVAASMS